MNREVLRIDAAAEAERIVQWTKETVRGFRKQGGVVGISGGIDSSVCLALAVRAFGAERVVALLLPDKDSDPTSEELARDLAAHYGVIPILEPITPAAEGFGCYERRDEAIARVFPEYDADAGYKAKIGLPSLLEGGLLNVFSVTIVTPDGEEKSARLGPKDFAQIVAATNFKQRCRTNLLYYHAELRNFAVVGTPNKNERDQGFFVKYGDGGYDLAPIAHLYKTQVYQLAAHLDVPEAIRTRTPTTDTYSAPSTQEEFFFRLPYETMDLLWYAQEHEASVEETAAALDMAEDQVRDAFADFTRKSRTTEYLRAAPQDMARLGEPITKVG